MRTTWRSRGPATRLAAIAAAVLIVDQVTKTLSSLWSGRTGGPVVPVRNHDLSFGVPGPSRPLLILAAAAGIVVLGGCAARLAARGRIPVWVGAFLVGGASSNLLDRVALGSVRDFVPTPWFVFNLADIAVFAGLAALVLGGSPRSSARKPREEVTS